MPRTDIKPAINAIHTENKETFETPEHCLLESIPAFPDILGEEGQFWWTYYAGLMIECGTLSRMFLGSLTNFCRLAELIMAYETEINESGFFIDVPKKYKGEEYTDREPNPLINEVRRMYDQFDRLATSMGMTPYSAKIHAIDATGGASSTAVSEPPPPEIIPYRKEA